MQLKKYILNWKKWLYYNRKLLIFGALFLSLVFLLYNTAKIKKVHCYCDGQVCEDSQCQIVSKNISGNFLNLNKRKIISELTSSGKYQRVNINAKFPNTVYVNLYATVDFLIFNSMITSELIKLSVDSPPISSESAVFFNKPSAEIVNWLKDYPLISLKIFPNGSYETVSTSSSQIYAITKEKKDLAWYKSAYTLIKTVLSYTSVSGVYFLDNNVYFAEVGKPDIIIGMDYEEQKLLKSLQSLGFLTTIKKDPKIIDLRYANPIIR